MAEYFYDRKEAENFIKKSTQGRPVLFAKIKLHGNEQWIVDYQQRDLGGSIQILQNLNDELDNLLNK